MSLNSNLSSSIEELTKAWCLTPGLPFQQPPQGAAWVAPATDEAGRTFVLKITTPHFEAEHEYEGLHFWNGDPTIHAYRHDPERHAMLLELCEPGTSLRNEPEPQQDRIIAALLRRLWRTPLQPHPFRTLSFMLNSWADEAEQQLNQSPDPVLEPELTREGIKLLRTLPSTATESTLLATDLHAGNVLRAQREPWLAIDPKPFIGDPCYDATQHLLNCPQRLLASPAPTIQNFAQLLNCDPKRIALYTFARAATTYEEPFARIAHAIRNLL